MRTFIYLANAAPRQLKQRRHHHIHVLGDEHGGPVASELRRPGPAHQAPPEPEAVGDEGPEEAAAVEAVGDHGCEGHPDPVLALEVAQLVRDHRLDLLLCVVHRCSSLLNVVVVVVGSWVRGEGFRRGARLMLAGVERKPYEWAARSSY